jgi:hypothetical protein
MDLLNFRAKRNDRQPGKKSAASSARPAKSNRPLTGQTPPAGWLDSSTELKGGLQVQEDDIDTIPPEFRDAFSSR